MYYLKKSDLTFPTHTHLITGITLSVCLSTLENLHNVLATDLGYECSVKQESDHFIYFT